MIKYILFSDFYLLILLRLKFLLYLLNGISILLYNRILDINIGDYYPQFDELTLNGRTPDNKRVADPNVNCLLLIFMSLTSIYY